MGTMRDNAASSGTTPAATFLVPSHRSSSTASSTSTDTLHAPVSATASTTNNPSLFRSPSRSRTPIQIKIKRKQELEQEAQISPTQLMGDSPHPGGSHPLSSNNVPLRENRRLSNDFANYRRDLAVLETSGGRIPSIQHNPPTALGPSPNNHIAPWMTPQNGQTMASTASQFGSSYYDDVNSDSHSITSQTPSGGLRPRSGTGERSGSDPYAHDERRPSLASLTTVSSNGSRGSVVRANLHKKLQGFFGEEYPGRDDASINSQGKEHRSNSYTKQRDGPRKVSTVDGRSDSPAPSRPRTPVPSSDVVPFLYQDSTDISRYGQAPVRTSLSGPDRDRYIAEQDVANPPRTGTSRSAASAKVGQVFHGHRHNRSDDSRTTRAASLADESMFTKKGKEQERERERKGSQMTPSEYKAQSQRQRGDSPAGSIRSQMTIGLPTSASSGPAQKKHGILSRFRRHGHKDKEESPAAPLKHLPNSVKSLVHPSTEPKFDGGAEPKQQGVPWNKDESFASFAKQELLSPVPNKNDAGQQNRPANLRQTTFTKLPFTRKGRGGSKQTEEHDPMPGDQGQGETQNGETKFDLDFDLTNMEGILSQPPPLHPLVDNTIYTGNVEDEAKHDSADGSMGLGWNAPDSWQVNKVDEMNISRLPEIDEDGILPKDNVKPHPYCIRIFKGDGTFATLSVDLNATVGDVIIQLAKKTHISDSLDNYQIVLNKHDLRRILGTGERPIVIQKRLLEQAGYEEKDDIEDLGREDQSYLCRFVFVPQRDVGYAAAPSFSKLQKFSWVDLTGKNLVTIPIALYSKATEIQGINLSRNLSLDLPKDFIQSCVNLHDIKYVSNEAWKLPLSISRAANLHILDVSNNRLEQLEHAELDRLKLLTSLKLANNRLTRLPDHFGNFHMLRVLNISSNFLEEFPAFLCRLRSLVDLDMSFNAISELPESIGDLENLERLSITNNRLRGSLPENFGKLRKLNYVDIRYNALQSIDVIASLPSIEQIQADHNSVSVFEGTFEKIRVLRLNSNPVTRFEIFNKVPSLTKLVLSNCKLAHIPDAAFDKMPNLEELMLDKNHFVSLPSHIGKLQKLEKFSIARNALSSLPPEIGCLRSLRFFNASQNNLKKLPAEIWWAKNLELMNISSNVLSDFPKPGSRAPQIPVDVPLSMSEQQRNASPGGTPSLAQTARYEDVGPLEGFGQSQRRPSQASAGLLAVGPPPPGSGDRKNSIVSIYGKGGRQASVVSRTASSSGAQEITPPPSVRKDSSFSERLVETFATSLKNLYLADNQLDDDVYDQLTLLGELRLLNLSYNELNDLPQRTLRSWPNLAELYLSGNDLTSLPADDFDDNSSLRVLHINGNKFQTLPAELGKAHHLAVLDVGSNSLKYNVSNWPYDWNWNCNPNLKYLNLSDNKRLNIKPNSQYDAGAGHRDERNIRASTDFNSLRNLRILGLMDVTLTIPNIPDETEDRRVRTSGTLAGAMSYGMADTLGRNEHLSIIDMVVPRFNSNESETLIGLFDGQTSKNGGSKIAKYLHENFGRIFTEQLKMINPALHDTPIDALRRAFLTLNKELACAATQYVQDHALVSHRGRSQPVAVLTEEDLKQGGVATVMFIEQMELYVANIGDAQALLIQSEGGHRILTRKHDPAEPSERQRIRDAGGWVSRQGKLNDELSVSRAFGYVHLMPAVQASPHVTQITLKEQDEMILLASSELWEYLSPELVVDVARSERTDLVRAAQKLRDLAMAFGATRKIMVMIVGVSDLKRRERNRLNRGPSMTMGPTGVLDDVYLPNKRGKRAKEAVEDSMLRRLQAEVQAPVGEISIVFTDIKGSTQLWETNQAAMRSSIKLHNEIMRRQLRIIGGYEVKTEGDAFMVSFPTATSALLWCFSVQAQLLEVQWPAEILTHNAGQEIYDNDNNLIFRGLSVRMGIHFGSPVCEKDTVTRRMDYFGPMVNKTARISSTADGGQITVSADFISEIQRCLETYSETDRNGSTGSEEQYGDDAMAASIRRELRSLSSQGFEVKPMGERKLRGLENPEYIYLMYPHALAGRIGYQPLLGCDLGEAEVHKQKEDERKKRELENNPPTEMQAEDRVALTVDPDATWTLWKTALRLEALCDGLEDGVMRDVTGPQVEMIEKVGARGGEITDDLLLGFMRNLVVRVESSISTLAIRQAVIEGPQMGPIKNIHDLQHPQSEILDQILKQSKLLQAYREKYGDLEVPEMQQVHQQESQSQSHSRRPSIQVER